MDTQQQALGRAIEARACGRYTEAVSIFQTELPDTETDPRLTIEYADLLSAQGLEHDRVSLLRKALAHARVDKSDGSKAVTTYTGSIPLLELMLADAEFWSLGKLQAALLAARKACNWLKKANQDALTDDEARGFRLYYGLIFMISVNSNLVEEEDKRLINIPSANDGLVEQTVSIMQSLHRQYRIRPAVLMASEALRFIQDVRRYQVIIDNIVEVLDWSDDQFFPSLASFSLRLLYAVLEKTRLQISVKTRQKVQGLVQRYLQLLADRTSPAWREMYPIVAFCQELHDVMEQETSVEKFAKVKALVESAKLRCDLSSANRALMSAIDVASAYARSRRTVDAFTPLRNTQVECLSLHRTLSGHGFFEALLLSALFSTLFVVWQAHDQIIEELDKFEKGHPEFDVPVMLYRLYNQGLISARARERTQLAGEMREKCDAAYEKCPMVNFDPEIGSFGLADEAKADPDLFVIEIDGVVPDENMRGLNAIGVCLRWAAAQVEKGIMSPEDWASLFGSDAHEDLRDTDQSVVYSRDKSRRIADVFYRLDHPSWLIWFRKVKAWLLMGRGSVPSSARLYALRAIAGTRAHRGRRNWIEKHANDIPNLEFALEIGELEAEVKAIEAQEDGALPTSSRSAIAEKSLNVFRTSVLASTTGAWPAGKISIAQIDLAVRDCGDLIQIYAERHNELGRFNTWCSKGRLLVNKYMNGGQVDVSAALEPFDEADTVFAQVRRNQLTTKSAITPEVLTKTFSSFSYRVLCNEALVVTRSVFNIALGRWNKALRETIEGESNEQRVQRIGALQQQGFAGYGRYLAWTQRSKARQLNDLLGIDTRLPQSLVDAYKASRTASEAVDREKELLADLSVTPFPENLTIYDQLEALRAYMRKDPLLAPVMAIRDGDTVDLARIYDMLQKLPDGVVLVDFVHMAGQGHLLAICYRKNKTFFPARLAVPPMDVLKREWDAILREDHPLNGPKTLAALEKLEPLLRPLFENQPKEIVFKHPNDPPCIQPGDTVIFCPTGILHRIPLHAIRVNGEPLIKQHPVVYCQSLTMQHRAWEQSPDLDHGNRDDNNFISPRRKVVINPMGLSTASSRELATKLGADYFGELNMKKVDVTRSLQDTAVFHYHGHVKIPKGQPMQAHLCLDETAYKSKSRTTMEGERLSAYDLFDIRFSRPSLATIIGCRSGVSEISDTDDLLGLPTALHYAGAATVISSLWKVDDADGALFASEFYDDLLEQSSVAATPQKRQGDTSPIGSTSQGGPRNVIDLARAMQNAVRKLMVDHHPVGGEVGDRMPYHWASVTLNGFWLFPRLTRGDVGKGHPVADTNAATTDKQLPPSVSKRLPGHGSGEIADPDKTHAPEDMNSLSGSQQETKTTETIDEATSFLPRDYEVQWICECGYRGCDVITETRAGSVQILARVMEQNGVRVALHPAEDNIGWSGLVRRWIRTVATSSYNIYVVWMRNRFWAASPQPQISPGTVDALSPQESTPPASTQESSPQESLPEGDELHPTGAQVLSLRKKIIEGREPRSGYLLLCIKDEKWLTTWDDLDVSSFVSDQQLFEAIRNRFFGRKGSWTRRAVQLKSVQEIQFVKFTLRPKREVDCLQPNELPPATETHYELDPRPAGYDPPMLRDFLMHRFLTPLRCGDQTLCLKQFPKRVERLPQVGVPPDLFTAWGLHFREGVDFGKVCLWGTLLFVVSLAFGIVWSMIRGSVTDGFAVAGYILAFEALLMGTIQAYVVL